MTISGLVLMVDAFQEDDMGAGIMNLLALTLWTIQSAVGIYTSVNLWRAYSSSPSLYEATPEDISTHSPFLPS